MKLLRKIARALNVDHNDLFLERGNRMNNEPSLQNGIRMAGPGDRTASPDKPGFTITWKIKCGADAIGKSPVGL